MNLEEKRSIDLVPFPEPPEHKQAWSKRIPDDDNRERTVCDHCQFIQYENPRIIVGSVVRHQTSADPEPSILLCRRAIPPREGYWTLPAGFMELGEDAASGAMREAKEEAQIAITITALLAVYSITHISQVQLIFRAELPERIFAAGPESKEVDLFRWSHIPWGDIAFPSVHWALYHDRLASRDRHMVPFQSAPSEDEMMAMRKQGVAL